jgi:hypothetical protein
MTLRRFSSRRDRLDHAYLSKRLSGARSYKRIAGYFRSSIFELVGEEVAGCPRSRSSATASWTRRTWWYGSMRARRRYQERWTEAPAEVEASTRERTSCSAASFSAVSLAGRSRFPP